MATITRVTVTGVQQPVVTIEASDGRAMQFDLSNGDGRRLLAALMAFNGFQKLTAAQELAGKRYIQMEL